MINDNKELPRMLFPFIWHFLRDYKFVVFAVVCLAFAAGFWGPFNSILIKNLINLLPSVNASNISIAVLPASLIVVNFIVFDNFTWRGAEYFHYKYRGIIKNKIIKTTFGYVLGGSHQFFQANFSGRISNQITTLADNIEIILDKVSMNFLRGFSLLLTAFLASFSVNPAFCLVFIVWFICFSSFSIYMSKRLVNLSDNHAENESLVSGQLTDVISNYNNVCIFSRRVFELLRIDNYLNMLLKSFKRQEGFSVILFSIQGAMIAIMMSFNIYFLVHFYGLRLLSIGDFALILGLSMELGYMMWFTMSCVDDFNQAYGKCKQSISALLIPMDIQDKPDAKPLKCDRGYITFKNVKFHYKGMAPLFHNKSIEIQAGQKVGFVGYSGGGKSTFVSLMLRLYDVTGGAILIDGQNICDVTQDSLRENIAIIPQDPSLFHRSLMDNIRYGHEEATDQETIEAAKKAHAHEFIAKLPQGYESLVGERGVKLSGGQRQRIAIARAILKNAPILILDEATSQLDSVTEALIQDSLWELMEGKTTIVIAHRLSTLLHMDRILVFDKGGIVEDGTHDELLAHAGLYKKLWDTQVGGFLGDKKQESEV